MLVPSVVEGFLQGVGFGFSGCGVGSGRQSFRISGFRVAVLSNGSNPKPTSPKLSPTWKPPEALGLLNSRPKTINPKLFGFRVFLLWFRLLAGSRRFCGIKRPREPETF